MTLFAVLFSLGLSFSALAEEPVISTPESPVTLPVAAEVAAAPALDAPVAVKKITSHIEFSFQMSLSNSYSIGNVDTWFEEITVPGEGLTDTAPGFNQFDLRWMMGDVGDKMRMGLGLAYYKGTDHGLNAASVAALRQFAATPKIYFMTIPFQTQLSAGSNTYLTFEPAIGVGMVSGYLTSGSTKRVFAATPRVGYQLGMGLDHYMGAISVFARFGYRLQKAAISYVDTAGKLKVYLVPSTNEEVVADLSGAYATMGLALSL